MISVFLSDTDEEDVEAMSGAEAASLLEALTVAADGRFRYRGDSQGQGRGPFVA